MLSTGSSGELFVDEALVQELNVAPPAFFVCAALAYLEYEEDAAAYHAANEDILD
ncbi:MAG: hypothetical protein INR71_12415 [Terriglobus roseus]|nr:hypothetical protein [Terriglobus roseus]